MFSSRRALRRTSSTGLAYPRFRRPAEHSAVGQSACSSAPSSSIRSRASWLAPWSGASQEASPGRTPSSGGGAYGSRGYRPASHGLSRTRWVMHVVRYRAPPVGCPRHTRAWTCGRRRTRPSYEVVVAGSSGFGRVRLSPSSCTCGRCSRQSSFPCCSGMRKQIVDDRALGVPHRHWVRYVLEARHLLETIAVRLDNAYVAPVFDGIAPPNRLACSPYAACFHDSSPQNEVMRSASSLATAAASDHNAFRFISMMGKLMKSRSTASFLLVRQLAIGA